MKKMFLITLLIGCLVLVSGVNSFVAAEHPKEQKETVKMSGVLEEDSETARKSGEVTEKGEVVKEDKDILEDQEAAEEAAEMMEEKK